MTIKISVVLSIHNRSKLFARALESYAWQTMPARDFEIVLIDDMSTEDLSKVYSKYLGKINIRHIKMDHTRHSAFKKRNPNWKAGDAFENWYHTPAISNNIGLSKAVGDVICLCHPEIIHAPQNFEIAARRLQDNLERAYLFGFTYLGSQVANQVLDGIDIAKAGWTGVINVTSQQERLKYFGPNELYWYTSFLPKIAAHAIRGVDFEYLDGAAGEDDDFKERVRLGGWPPIHAPEIKGFHQDHSDEKEKHRQRNNAFWEEGLKHNRAVLASRRQNGFPLPGNMGVDWTGAECIVEDQYYPIEESGTAGVSHSTGVTAGGSLSIKKVLMATINHDHPQRGMEHVFQSLFGRENVLSFDFLEEGRRGSQKPKINNDFLALVKSTKPDWIWLQVQDSNVIQPETITALRRDLPGCVVTHWMGDIRSKVKPYLSEICKVTHLTLISSVGQIPLFQDAGAKRVQYCQVGVDWNEDVLGKPAWVPPFKVPDVVFIGNHYGVNIGDDNFPGVGERLDAIRALKDAGIDVGVVGTGWPADVPMIGSCKVKQQHHVWKRAKVALSVNHFNNVELYYSDRHLVSMASGTPLVCKYVPGLEKEFTHGVDLFWYESTDELVDIVKTLLSNDDFRQKVGRQGRYKVMSEHTWFNRIISLIPTIEEMQVLGKGL
jgi:glycosyltransferase involved in cell wall biosynthesis